MTWQRFNTWQRCCSASKRFTNASDPGASRLAAAWDNEAKNAAERLFQLKAHPIKNSASSSLYF